MAEEETEGETEEETKVTYSVDKELDLWLFSIYNEMPKDFRDNLSFEAFYNFHRNNIKAQEFQQELGADDDTEESENKEVIPPEELCKNCQKEQRNSMDKDFCFKCIQEFQEKAEVRTKELKGILRNDPKFKSCSSSIRAVAYVKEAYADEAKKNKFVHLVTIAKEEYALMKS